MVFFMFTWRPTSDTTPGISNRENGAKLYLKAVREADRQTDRQTETDRQTDRQTERQTDRQTMMITRLSQRCYHASRFA